MSFFPVPVSFLNHSLTTVMAVFFFLEPLEIPGMFLHLCRMKVNKHNLYFFDAVTENLNGKNQAA